MTNGHIPHNLRVNKNEAPLEEEKKEKKKGKKHTMTYSRRGRENLAPLWVLNPAEGNLMSVFVVPNAK